MMVAILHANVGTEVGAFILQSVVLQYHQEFLIDQNEEGNN